MTATEDDIALFVMHRGKKLINTNIFPSVCYYEGCSKRSATLSVLQSKSTANVCNFFLWLLLNVPLATAGSRNNTFSRACAQGRQKWLGRLISVFNNRLLLNFSRQRRNQ